MSDLKKAVFVDMVWIRAPALRRPYIEFPVWAGAGPIQIGIESLNRILSSKTIGLQRFQ
jgi:hypothetical protein